MKLADQIKWIKNVKRDHGKFWAYNEYHENESFLLAFGPKHKGGAEKPKIGDIIVLFQTVDRSVNGVGGTYLTHLLSVNTTNSACTCIKDYPIGRGVAVLAKTSPIDALKSDKIGLLFNHVNSGQLCDFDLFNKEKSPEMNRQYILQLFEPFSLNSIS